MKAKILSTIMAVSFIVCAVTIADLSILFWMSLTIFSFSCLYASKHEKSLSAELDDLFGKDDELR
jgi:hypothetical protein|nr:MAG TPA: hypothetical protein [Caudoviricetes sp.]